MDHRDFVEKLKADFPGFSIEEKDSSRWMKFFDLLLKMVTLWRLNDFMTKSTTVFGGKMYVTKGWKNRSEKTKIITLRHERKHLEQKKKYGGLWFSFLYLFVPVPMFFAYFRRKFEQEAYAETIAATAEAYGAHVLIDDRFRASMVGHFTSYTYAWTWVVKGDIEEWYDSVVDSILE